MRYIWDYEMSYNKYGNSIKNNKKNYRICIFLLKIIHFIKCINKNVRFLKFIEVLLNA